MKQPAKNRRSRPVDSDNAWKELLDRHFADFLRFFFPNVHAAIDWSRKPVFLDKELPKLGPKHLRGDRLADKLAKVWLKTGQRLFIILHTEIQGEARIGFNQRMYVYHYRIEDRYNCPVVSLGVVTGGTARMALGRHETDLLGCRSVFEFPVVKLQDWRGREAELLASDDPFALVVLAHLKVRTTRNHADRKYAVKRELALLVYNRGDSSEYVGSLLRFLDWLIRLPEGAEEKLGKEIEALKGEKRMPYITSWERIAEKRGRKEGRKESLLKVVLSQLRKKLGRLDAEVKANIETLSLPALTQLAEALLDFSEVADLEVWLGRKAE